jgi:hypothetical protein
VRGLGAMHACIALTPARPILCREAEEAARLAAVAAAMAPSDFERIAADAATLLERQATPDSPEALACIPSLQLSDLPTSTPPLTCVVQHVALGVPEEARSAATTAGHASASRGATSAAPALRGLGQREALRSGPLAAASSFEHIVSEQPTSGIAYSSLYFDLSPLPQVCHRASMRRQR